MAEPIHVVKTITVNRSPEEVYRFWRDFENLPRFMSHLESVQRHGRRPLALDGQGAGRHDGRVGRRDRRGPAERADRLALARRADVHNAGSVRFVRRPAAAAPRCASSWTTAARPATLGAAVARLFGEEPGQQVQRRPARFKQVMETGEMVAPTPAAESIAPRDAGPRASRLDRRA